jgi:ribose transport system substrate-binding protein
MRRLIAVGSVAVTAALLLASCSSGDDEPSAGADTSDTSTPESSAPESSAPAEPTADDSPLKIVAGELNFNFTDYCGDKPVVVGILDGYGGNAWATGKSALVKQLAESCPNVTEVKYADAGGDVQKYIAAINSFVAQGVNIIETFDYMGEPTVPAFRQAQARGVLVGNANAIPGSGEVPKDFSSVVVPDFDGNATQWVEFLTKATNDKGRIAYVGGPAGNLFDAPQIEAIEKAIADQGSGITLVSTDPLVGAWDPATTQQVVAGLLQNDDKIDGIINSYTATGPAVVRAFEAADVPLPAMTGQSSSMELVCMAHDYADKGLKVQSLDGTPNLHAIDLAKLLAQWSGMDVPELGPTDAYTTVTLADYINTEENILPDCDKSVPPGADFSEAMDPEDLAAALS